MSQKEEITYAEEITDENSVSAAPAEKLKLVSRSEKLKLKLKKCQKEKEDYLVLAQRAQADLINFRRRQEQLNDEFRKYNQADLIRDLLPVLDSLEAAARSKDEKTGKDIKLIKEQIEAILKNRGLKEIKSLGEKFNPQFHEAVELVETDDEEEGAVVEEIQKGYLFYDKVLRAGKVKVAK